jgi:hypothetical protein
VKWHEVRGQVSDKNDAAQVAASPHCTRHGSDGGHPHRYALHHGVFALAAGTPGARSREGEVRYMFIVKIFLYGAAAIIACSEQVMGSDENLPPRVRVEKNLYDELNPWQKECGYTIDDIRVVKDYRNKRNRRRSADGTQKNERPRMGDEIYIFPGFTIAATKKIDCMLKKGDNADAIEFGDYLDRRGLFNEAAKWYMKSVYTDEFMYEKNTDNMKCRTGYYLSYWPVRQIGYYILNKKISLSLADERLWLIRAATDFSSSSDIFRKEIKKRYSLQVAGQPGSVQPEGTRCLTEVGK